MSSKTKKNHLLDLLGDLGIILKDTLVYAKRNLQNTTKLYWFNAFLAIAVCFSYSINNTHYYQLGIAWDWLTPVSSKAFVELLYRIPWYVDFTLLFLITFIIFAAVLGHPSAKLVKKLKSTFKQIGLKNSIGKPPKIKDVQKFSNDRFYVQLNSNGISLDEFKKSEGRLRASVNSHIESIAPQEENPAVVEVVFNKKPLTKKVSYSELSDLAKKPGDIIIGRSMSGDIVENISSYPHMLVAGSTGFGKSYFLKQMTLGLLENTPNLQVYIFDFKEGISFKMFKELPNVRLYRDLSESNVILDKLKEEMTERLKLVSEGKGESLNLEKTKKDPVLIMIDECSMLFSLSKHDKVKRNISIKAIELADEIAKLGRAAKYNIVLGNQKITGQTVDTRIQENLLGRICFKVPSVSGSNTVLGNKSASCLPAIKGRAIYKFNALNEEVQTPFLGDSELESRLSAIKNEFKKNKRRLNSVMLGDKEIAIKSKAKTIANSSLKNKEENGNNNGK